MTETQILMIVLGSSVGAALILTVLLAFSAWLEKKDNKDNK